MRELGLTEVKAILASVSYKPGWTIEVEGITTHFEQHYSMAMRVQVHTVDSRRLVEGPFLVESHRPMPMVFNRDDVLMWVHHALWDLERHELDEFFQVDGKPVHDPHTHPPVDQQA